MSVGKKIPSQAQTQRRRPIQHLAQSHKQNLLQPKAAAPQRLTPTAPPVYRPQPVPKVLQRKAATVRQPPPGATKSTPTAPPVYRPQPMPRVLQPKATAPVQPAPQAKRPPTAPPVYNPQPVPRVLQAKKATAAHAPSVSNKKGVTVSPITQSGRILQAHGTHAAPKAPPHGAGAPAGPAPHLRPRGIVIQRKLGNKTLEKIANYILTNPGVVGKLTFEWGAAEDDPSWLLPDKFLAPNYDVLKKGLEAENAKVTEEHIEQLRATLAKVKGTGLRLIPPQVQLVQVNVPVIAHLDEFHRNTDQVENSHNPQDVLGHMTVTGAATVEIGGGRDDNVNYSTEEDNLLDSQVAEIQRPERTKNDGEVRVLVRALKYFTKQMQAVNNRNKQLTFTLAISGPEGPCDDCRARLDNFVAYWKQKVKKYINNGVQANLKITSKYFKAPGLRNSGRYYGWQADSASGPPYLHTITEIERGQNA